MAKLDINNTISKLVEARVEAGKQGLVFLQISFPLLDMFLDTLKAVRDLNFTVIDKKTGKYPDYCKIALNEEWAKGLIYCDMEGIAIEEDGALLLLDECGNQRYCPSDRFEIVWGGDGGQE